MPHPRHAVPSDRIAAMRRFNRFYTRLIGVLDARHLRSPYSLAEVRILYELAHREGLTASDLARDLGLDPGYASRTLAAFARRGLLQRLAVAGDRRAKRLVLTGAGHRVFARLDRAAAGDVRRLLGALSEADQQRIVGAMATIAALLGRDRP